MTQGLHEIPFFEKRLKADNIVIEKLKEQKDY